MTIGDIVLGGAAVIGIIATFSFILSYSRRAGMSWSTSQAGRYLMIHHALLGSLFTIILVNRFNLDWPGREFVTAFLLVGFAVHSFAAYQLVRQSYEQKEADNGTDDIRQEDALS